MSSWGKVVQLSGLSQTIGVMILVSLDSTLWQGMKKGSAIVEQLSMNI